MLTAEIAEAVREVAWESRIDLMERRIELLGIVEDGNNFVLKPPEALETLGNKEHFMAI